MRVRTLMLLAVSLIFTLPMMADVTYTYQGQDFNVALGGIYTTSDFVSGSFTVSTALADNAPEGSVTPLSFSFSDGVQTLDSSNSKMEFGDFGTDANGNITTWNIEIYVPGSTLLSIVTEHDSEGNMDEGLMPAPDQAFHIHSDATGTWSAAVDASPVPEPSSFALLGTGVLGLVGASRRRFAR